MGIGQKVWDRYCESQVAMRYWEIESRICGKRLAGLNLSIAAASSLLLLLAIWGELPLLLPLGGFAISLLGLVMVQYRIAERAAAAKTAQALWYAIDGEYRKLEDRIRNQEEVTEPELASVIALDDALSAVTIATFGPSDRKKVVEAEDRRDEFLGVKPG